MRANGLLLMRDALGAYWCKDSSDSGVEAGNRHQEPMDGDPNKCRVVARRCEELAATAKNPASKERLLALALGWTHLATVLETTREIILRFGGGKRPDK